MNAIWGAIFAVAGLFAGSGLWVVARNQASRRMLLSGPRCDADEHEIGIAAWLPLLGFGTVRACPIDGEPRAANRAALELGVALYWGTAALLIDDWQKLIAALVFTAPLLVILLVDAWTKLVHVNVILAGIALGLVFAGMDGFDGLLSALGMLVGVLIFVFFFVLAMVIYRNPKVVPFGLGDVYLAGMIGAMVTFDEVIRALVYGVFFGGLCVALLLVSKRVSRKQAIPYGPFLVIGALIALLS